MKKKTLKLTPDEHASFRFFIKQYSTMTAASNAVGIKRTTLSDIVELGRGNEENITLIKELLGGVIGDAVANKIIEGIQQEWGINRDQLNTKTSRRQALRLVEAKQAACYLLVKYTNLAYEVIANLLGYPSRQIVGSSADSVVRVIEVDMSLREKLVKIECSIKK